eukprot:TRINITY_DN2475_c0_g1_i4.p2 TRINITY_DN2475_c0_g1~~TRINITY_DN2475_c0_g1_i4.p2  ORF type:complete len:120 (-),score=32.79 TRINITY_DN2475_c0_g1_i4:86-445(-)
MNYRSVVLYGKGVLLDTHEEKMHGLEVISDQVMPGRWAEARVPNETEMKSTSVLEMQITSASAKVRTGPPMDDQTDIDELLNVWSGVLPIRTTTDKPIPDPTLKKDIQPTSSIINNKFD